MTEFGTLLVRVDKYLEGQGIRQAVPVRIRRVRRRVDEVDDRPEPPPLIAAPASQFEWARSRVATGTYEFEAILPSGEILTGRGRVRANRNTKVVLRGQHSPNEWRSWAHFSGARDASPTAMRLGRHSAEPIGLDRPEIMVSVGTQAKATSSDFSVESWTGWYRYLDERWHEAERPGFRSSNLELREHGELAVDVFPGGRGEPTLVKVRTQIPDWISPLEVGNTRPFVAVSSARGTRVVSIPWPWLSHTYRGAPFFELLISETETELLCEPVVRDDHVGGIIAYLNAGRVSLAGELLTAAHGALFEKYHNPLGAAAGGYVLLSTDASNEMKEWPNWLENLASSFPNLPDGPILRARWLLEQGDSSRFQEARHWLRQAFKRGIPFFTAGVAWLIEGYQRIAADDWDARDDLQLLRTVARSMDLTKGITSLRIPVREAGGAHLTMHQQRAPANTYVMPIAIG